MPAEAQRSDRHRDTAVAVSAALALAIGGAVVAAWVDAGSSEYRGAEILTALVLSITAVIGATVVLSAPANALGWLVVALAVSGGLGEALTESGVHGELHPGSVAGSAWLVMFGVMFRTLSGLLGTAAIPAFYPDGRLPGPRWRWLGGLLALGVVLTVLASFLAPIETRLGDHWRGPLTPLRDPANSPLEGLNLLVAFVMLVAALGALGGLVMRWRRGSPVVRQQLLLFVCAVAVDVAFLVGVIGYVIATPHAPGRGIFALLGLPIPIAIAIATLNHGLYDLRRATNRTLLYLLVTGATAVVYVVAVVIAASLARDRHALWPSLLAAATASAALIPLRDRLQRVVTRVVYGRWREPYALLSGLRQQLSAAADIDQLLRDTAAQLSAELDLSELGVVDHRGALVAGGQGGADVVPLVAYGRVVGTLCFTASRDLSASEDSLMLDLASHVAILLDTRRSQSELQHTRERLVLGREEERRRLRRDLHDGIGPALAGLTLKAETALAALPPEAAQSAAQLQALSEEIRATVNDVRRVVEGLRPPALDELGLTDACSQAIVRLTTGTHITTSMSAGPLPPLPAALEVATYRIVQEAATNAVRHAQPSRLDVTLTLSGPILDVHVVDDGGGMASRRTRDGNGLHTMTERAEELGGVLIVSSGPEGTDVNARLPLTPSAVAAAANEGPR